MGLDVRTSIESRLNDLFIKRLNLDVLSLDKSELEKDILSSDMGYEPRDLVYLYFDIEEEFEITFSQVDIFEGRFNSYNNIINLIYNALSKKKR